MTSSEYPEDIVPADWAHWSNRAPVVIRPLTSGLTNRSYLISADDTPLVLRKNSPISAALDLDRAAEARALQLADSAGLAAPLVHCDPQHRYLVTRYIHGTAPELDAAGALTALAELLRRIHQLPTIAAELDIANKVASYWRAIGDGEDFFQPLQDLHKQVQPHIAAAQSLSRDKVLCHNDLLQSNLIAADDGKLYAIDWEYAASGDPFYDLAVISEGNAFGEEKSQALLSAYLQRGVSESDQRRLFHWRVIYRYLALLWYAVQETNRNSSTAPGRHEEIVKEIAGLRKFC